MADECTVPHLGSCPTTCPSTRTNNACIKFPNRNDCKQGEACKLIAVSENCGVQYACQPTVVSDPGTDFTFTIGINDQPNRAIISNIYGYTLPSSVTGTVTLQGVKDISRKKLLQLTSLPASVTSVTIKNSGVVELAKVPLGPGVTSLSLEGNNSPVPTFPDPSSQDYAKFAGLTRLDLTN
ncbi:hypothetical protein DYB31_015502 [Aphanomyces astaci]|uniref:Uncharacterized protein n=1 Tax=Aphanomyces astaci TaxID=112090 RepID=A0A397FV91_APHAT|nr:hypothetical protein DYB31_015502 [Aphanomyces astaci]